MQTFFISDTHFNCPGLVEATRPWTTVEDHDQHLLDAINVTVGVRDRLIIAGDFCKGKPYKWRSQIRCRNIWLVLGNHDLPVAQYRHCFGDDRVRESMLLKFRMPEQTNLVYVSHYPHVHYPHSHYGAFHLYGHVHSQKEDEMDAFMPTRRSMDIGVDNLMKLQGTPCPIPIDDVWKRLATRIGHGIIKREDRWRKKDYGEDE